MNASVAQDEMLSGCQIHRFLILHKELDADDGELTRTRKVRRNIIADKFDDLLTALYDGSTEIFTTTEVTYEDGAKGQFQQRWKSDQWPQLRWVKPHDRFNKNKSKDANP